MTPEEYKWTINLVRDRYHQFKLSFEQAEKIFEFEKTLDLHSTKYFFSTWEEEDFILDNFRKILNEKQLKKFIGRQKQNIRRHEQHLTEGDKEQEKYIKYYNELIDFYEQRIVPEFLKEKIHIDIAISIESKAKVEFLKQEYKKYLDEQKLNILTSHYRHNKLFSPNQLEVKLLMHKLECIIPIYFSFKNHIDKPTKAVANFLIKKYHYIPTRLENFFKLKQQEYSSAIEEIKSKHIGEIKGWHTTITETELQQIENQIMQVVLMDKEKYGC